MNPNKTTGRYTFLIKNGRIKLLLASIKKSKKVEMQLKIFKAILVPRKLKKYGNGGQGIVFIIIMRGTCCSLSQYTRY